MFHRTYRLILALLLVLAAPAGVAYTPGYLMEYEDAAAVPQFGGQFIALFRQCNKAGIDPAYISWMYGQCSATCSSNDIEIREPITVRSISGYLKQNCDGTLTLMKNCTATALTCVQTATSSGCTATGGVSFIKGDTFNWRWENTPDPTCAISNGYVKATYTRP